MRRSLVLAVSLLLSSTLVLAAEFRGKVVGVADGDTLTVLHNGRGEKVRLYGVDCPEKKQAFGSRAKQFTSELAFGQVVTVVVVDVDRYKRAIGRVTLPDGRVLNHEIVRAGFGWWYRSFAKKDRELERLQTEARLARRGLWADADPTPPWQFRRQRALARQ